MIITDVDSGLEPIPGTGPGKLYVFIHGLICLVQKRDGLLGLVVDMGEDHSYRLGDWLVEVPMKKGAELKLSGVKAGDGGFDKSVVTVLHKPLDTEAKRYATIELPRPASKICSLRRTRIPAALLAGQEATSLANKGQQFFTLAAVHVLEYDFEELSDVYLEGGEWGPPTVFRETRAATLHFFAEPEQIKTQEHNIKEFREAAGMFRGLDLSIRSAVTMSKLEADEYPKDLSSNEALSLIERRFLLTALAAGYKEGMPGDLPAPSRGGSGGVLCAPMAVEMTEN